MFKRKKSARADSRANADSLADKFPDFDKFPGRPLGPVQPGFKMVRSFWRGERWV